jgi:hypothetical protein
MGKPIIVSKLKLVLFSNLSTCSHKYGEINLIMKCAIANDLINLISFFSHSRAGREFKARDNLTFFYVWTREIRGRVKRSAGICKIIYGGKVGVH